MAKTAIVQLGKRGDILNILPLAKKISDETGERVGVVVAEEFKDCADGCSYVSPIVMPGSFMDVKRAQLLAAQAGYQNILTTQVYGLGIRLRPITSSFCLDAWNAVGRLKDYGAPLIIDQRSPERESKLAEAVLPKTDKPIILTALAGQSSPFPYSRELILSLQENFHGLAEIVDISDVRAERFYDLLGLYDRASALVLIDTGHLHLANAKPELPVCALIASGPTNWHGSPKRKNHVFHCRYNDYRHRESGLILALAEALKVKPLKTNISLLKTERLVVATRPDLPQIRHVWSEGSFPSPDTKRRMDVARESWMTEAVDYGNWMEFAMRDEDIKRNGQSVGDTAPLPFVRDMIEHAAEGARDDDIIVITNSDIGLCRGVAKRIAEACKSKGSAFCHRWDFGRLDAPIGDKAKVMKGVWYPGCDLFAFTKSWWIQHGHKFPDLLLGRETWDWVMRVLVNETGGTELHAEIFHEKHDSFWSRGSNRANNPGNIWNRSFARDFLTQRKIPLREISNAPHFLVKNGVRIEQNKAVDEAPFDNSKVLVGSMVGSPPRFATPPGDVKADMDVVIALGKGSKWNNNELRYCLRGLERHAIGLRRVFVVGEDPGFLGELVTHIPVNEPNNSKEHNIAYVIKQACMNPDISDDFIFFNDDHFLISEFHLRSYPYYSKGDLASGAAHATAAGYKRALENTLNALRNASKPTRSYEVHVPIIYNKAKFISLSDWWNMSAHTPFGFVARSIYVNALGLSGPTITDMKIRQCAGPEDVARIVRGRNVFSIADSAVGKGVAEYLNKMYPSKSKFEKQ